MHVIVDGIIYGRQRFGGVNTYGQAYATYRTRHAYSGPATRGVQSYYYSPSYTPYTLTPRGLRLYGVP